MKSAFHYTNDMHQKYVCNSEANVFVIQITSVLAGSPNKFFLRFSLGDDLENGQFYFNCFFKIVLLVLTYMEVPQFLIAVSNP
jgi:hypothetical protein